MKATLAYIRTLCKFVLLALLVGLICGAVGVFLYLFRRARAGKDGAA